MPRRANLITFSAVIRLCILSLIATKQLSTLTINNILHAQRQRIRQEMKNFEYSFERFGNATEKLNDLTIETNGNPVRSIIITKWRSGSTFLGDILNSMPGNYYHYEPLYNFDIEQTRVAPGNLTAINNLIDFLKCDYSNMTHDLLAYGRDKKFLLPFNKRLWSQCKQFCWDATFLTRFCKLFPLQSMKIVRLQLALAEKLLADESLNVRVLYLVRDPRGIMRSQNNLLWCPSALYRCTVSNICKDLVLDYAAAEHLLKKYPSRFMTLRYEDLSLNPYKMTQEILEFFGLPFHPLVKKFLDTHTKFNRGDLTSTFRDSKSTPFQWIKNLTWPEIQNIELSCQKAMTLWGYQQVKNMDNLIPTFDPLITPPPKIYSAPGTINYILIAQRERIRLEMKNFEYSFGRFGNATEKLTDLTIETNGNPVRSIIITTWSSGSSFLGDILNSMPSNYYHYEPLYNFDIEQTRVPASNQKAIHNLIDFLKCDYSNMTHDLAYGKDKKFLLSFNERLWSQCKPFCWNAKFLTRFCKLFPLQSMKIVRLRLALAEKLLADESLNVRMLYLVRDPRGTMQSRKYIEWCPDKPYCDIVQYLCMDLVLDYAAAKYLLKKYPSRFRTLRYEDLSFTPYKMTQEILEFFGLPFHPLVKKFLDTHTKFNRGDLASTFRNSNSTPFQWIKNLTWPEIQNIELSCQKAMRLWGYRQVKNMDNLIPTFVPLLTAPLFT